MIEPMTERELKPCPFCGQDRAIPVVEARGEHLAVFVFCHSCGGSGSAELIEIDGTKYRTAFDVHGELESMTEAVIDAWNMRPKEKGA